MAESEKLEVSLPFYNDEEFMHLEEMAFQMGGLCLTQMRRICRRYRKHMHCFKYNRKWAVRRDDFIPFLEVYISDKKSYLDVVTPTDEAITTHDPADDL